MGVITHPYPNLSQFMLIKGAQEHKLEKDGIMYLFNINSNFAKAKSPKPLALSVVSDNIYINLET